MSDDVWTAAHARIASRRAVTTISGSDRRGRSGTDSKYFGTGFLRCGACRGPLGLIKQPATYRHTHVYVCRDRRVYGAKRCTFRTAIEMNWLDGVVMDTLRNAFTADRYATLLDDATADAPRSDVARLTKELATVNTKIKRIADAVENGLGDFDELKARLQPLRRRHAELTDAIAASASAVPSPTDRQRAAKLLADGAAAVRDRLDAADVPVARQLLRDTLQDRPIYVHAFNGRGVRLRAEVDLLMLLTPGQLAKPLPDSVLLRLSSLRRTQPYITLDVSAPAAA